MLQRHGGMPDDGPQRARGLAQLFVDQRLLHLRAALATDFARVIDAVQAVLDHGRAQRILGRARQLACRLELELVREENAFGESLRPRLPGQVFRGSVRSMAVEVRHSRKARPRRQFRLPQTSGLTSISRTRSTRSSGEHRKAADRKRETLDVHRRRAAIAVEQPAQRKTVE